MLSDWMDSQRTSARQMVLAAVGWLAALFNCLAALFSCLAALSGNGSFAFAADPPPAESKPPAAAALLEIEDQAEPLDPARPRNESEQDKVEAAALFSAGRMLEQQENQAGALRKYERAFRYDSESDAILAELVPLAFSLGRNDEAVRYALVAVERNPTDPVLLKRLALLLTEQGDWRRAAGLYEALLKSAEGQKNTADVVLVRLELGRLYFLLDDLPKAAESFQVVRAALANPQQFGLDERTQKALAADGALNYSLFGECLLATGKLNEAEDAFRQSHRAKSNRGQLGYNLARVEAKRGKPVEALEKLNDYFQQKLSTDGAAPYELLAQLHADINSQDTLPARLEELREADRDNPALGCFVAARHLQKGELTKAEAIYRQLTKKVSSRQSFEAYEGLIETTYAMKQPVELLRALGDAATKIGTLDPFKDQLQTIAAEEGLLDKLIESARAARAAQGDDKPGKRSATTGQAIAIAQLALHAKRFEVAGEFYPLAIRDDPQRAAELTTAWGLELFLADQFDAAATVFREGLERKVLPADNAAYPYYLAGALELAGQTDAALAAADEAGKIDADSAQFAGRRAWILYHAKRYDDALAAYKELIARFDARYDSTETRAALREARSVISNIYVVRGDYPQAEEWLEQVLDEFPEDHGALNDLGYLWADQNKRLERARRMIERAVAEEPDNKAFQDSLGWVYFRLGRFDDAIAALSKAAAVDDADGVILEHLGDAYDKAGKADEARASWQRAAAAFERDHEADKAARVRGKIK